jgi:predicted ATPase
MNAATFNYAQELMEVMRDADNQLDSNPLNISAHNRWKEAKRLLPDEFVVDDPFWIENNSASY